MVMILNGQKQNEAQILSFEFDPSWNGIRTKVIMDKGDISKNTHGETNFNEIKN